MAIYYVIPPENLIPKFAGKELLLRVQAGPGGADSLAYLTFADATIGAEYLKKRMPNNEMQLVTREELESRGVAINENFPTVFFATLEDVDNAIADKSGVYIKTLLR